MGRTFVFILMSCIFLHFLSNNSDIFRILPKRIDFLPIGGKEVQLVPMGRAPASDSRKVMKNKGKQGENVFVTILCTSETLDEKKKKTHLDTPDKIQVDQLVTLIKSAVALTSQILKFVVLTETPKMFRILEQKVQETLPDEYRKKISLHNEKVWYPETNVDLRNIYRTCSTAKLFIADFLPYDSVIYLDTDTLFMRPPEDLWQVFEDFSTKHVAAMTPVLSDIYFAKAETPFYGRNGLNPSVMPMNLTRLQQFPGGWSRTLLIQLKKMKRRIIMGDQDVLSIVFKEKPEFVYELSCDWNFMSLYCHKTSPLCPPAMANGISILHGNNWAFNREKEKYFKTVYEVWQQYSLTSPIEELWAEIEAKLAVVAHSNCPEVKNFSHVLLKRVNQ